MKLVHPEGLAMSLPRLLPLLALLLAAEGCASQTNTQPPGAPPTPKTVTSANPGGDADDPESAALARLTAEPWGFRRDFWNTLHVPLADWKNWRRVRIFGHPTRASYRYGDDHYAVASIWYTTIEGPNEPEACLAKFIDMATPIADANGVRIGERQRVRMTQSVGAEIRPMIVDLVEGRLDSLLGRDDYVGAIAAYQSFPGTCLVQGFAVVATEHRDAAKKVRDRWVAEGASKLVWERHVKQAPEPLTR
ncbi:hypothetical protein [Polyangium sp. y55x31]|uniref:hypothetical protein n=1 Tax=Polyangium sp. y55x31 TaxID=3042688 RepID=UPI00248226F2|nr:hypothetical protein [Polyangium sp. y55x31]MDI1484042.1 hypothetical protein [Polyangium sp. y55x31]